MFPLPGTLSILILAWLVLSFFFFSLPSDLCLDDSSDSSFPIILSKIAFLHHYLSFHCFFLHSTYYYLTLCYVFLLFKFCQSVCKLLEGRTEPVLFIVKSPVPKLCLAYREHLKNISWMTRGLVQYFSVINVVGWKKVIVLSIVLFRKTSWLTSSDGMCGPEEMGWKKITKT